MAAPGYLLDVVELAASADHLLELPWHLAGAVDVLTPGTWSPGTRRRIRDRGGALLAAERGTDHAPAQWPAARRSILHLHVRGRAAARIGAGPARRRRAGAVPPARGCAGATPRIVAVLDVGGAPVRSLTVTGGRSRGDRRERGGGRSAPAPAGAGRSRSGARACGAGSVDCAGAAGGPTRSIDCDQPRAAAGGGASRRPSRPRSTARLDGFDAERPARARPRGPVPPQRGALCRPRGILRHGAGELGQRRGLPGGRRRQAGAGLPGPTSAARCGWTTSRTTSIPTGSRSTCGRRRRAGVRLPGRFRPTSRAASGSTASAAPPATPAMVTGGWARTETGYRMTVAVALPELVEAGRGDEIGFDLIVNEMRPDRLRRAGQLVWSGGGGWVYLRGDRQDRRRGSGVLELHVTRPSPASPPPAASGPTRSSAPRPTACRSRMARSSGCRVWDDRGPRVPRLHHGARRRGAGLRAPGGEPRRRSRAVRDGVVGPLPPVLEEELAAELSRRDAVDASRCASSRPARRRWRPRSGWPGSATGRDLVLGCGYHGWLDWCQPADGAGVPAGHARALRRDPVQRSEPRPARPSGRPAIGLAAVVFEPVVLREPATGVAGGAAGGDRARRRAAGLRRDQDGLPPGDRVGPPSAIGVDPDLVVLGKAMANGFPARRRRRRARR